MERSPWDPEAVVELALEPSGRLSKQSAAGGNSPEHSLNPERCYEVMLAARRVDLCLERLALPAWASAAGEEAPAAALGLAMAGQLEASTSPPTADEKSSNPGVRDRIFPGRRDLALPIALGVPLAELLVQSAAPYHAGAAEHWRAFRSDEGRSDSAKALLAQQHDELGLDLLLATGDARVRRLAAQLGDALTPELAAMRNGVTVACFGEGLTTHASFLEATSIAVAADLPLVFVSKSRQWADSAPAEAGILGDNLADRARACGLWTRRIDGADCIGIHHYLRRAIERAREGHGPALLDLVVTPASLQPPGHRDPIERLRRHLHRRGLWTEEYAEQLDDRITELLDAGISLLSGLGFPVPEGFSLESNGHGPNGPSSPQLTLTSPPTSNGKSTEDGRGQRARQRAVPSSANAESTTSASQTAEDLSDARAQPS